MLMLYQKLANYKKATYFCIGIKPFFKFFKFFLQCTKEP